MAEGDGDFQVRLVPIENGYLVKRLGRVWFFRNIGLARGKIDDLILGWEEERSNPFKGGRG
ncbi:MAG: hypothetical protein CME21_21535 [Gemmatimonadetes bacterium]|nr:hypothetical protein [Gemmatimonadota bacterium]